MNIAEIITPERISICEDIQSKKRALEEVSKLLDSGTPFVSDTEIFTSLINREKLGSTGVGMGIALPHGRLKGVEQAVGALLRLGQGVDFESPDGSPVDIIFGLIVPEEATEDHLKILAGLAELGMQEDFGAKVRAAADAEALHRLLAGSSD